jgi:hypothetical protein
VDGEDVRVVQRGDGARLALEARHPAGVLGARGGQHLHRHVALEPAIEGRVDLAHAAGAEQRSDFIGSEPGGRVRSLQLPHRLQHVDVERGGGRGMGGHQLLDLLAQGFVAGAARGEEAAALRFRQGDRGVKELVQPLPPVVAHAKPPTNIPEGWVDINGPLARGRA